MKRAVILLGAGAPHGWGAKLTSSITEIILKDTEYKTKSGENLGKYIFTCLSSYYGNEKLINFETIINALEDIHDYYYNNGPKKGLGPNFRGAAPAWFNLDKNTYEEVMNYAFTSTTEITYLNDVIKHYLSIIFDAICEYDTKYTDNEDKKNLSRKLQEFLFFLKDKEILPRIYTTNYDRFIQSIFDNTDLKFFDGFTVSLKTDPNKKFRADLKTILNDDNCLTYYNLHGSIYWNYKSYISSDDIPEPRYEYICIPDESQNPIFSHSYPVDPSNPGEITTAYNIVTGYKKLQRVSIEPLSSFHTAFKRDCINADFIITVGYSFSDFHINKPIKNAVLANQNIKILNIDFAKETENYLPKEVSNFNQMILKSGERFSSDAKITDKKWLRSRTEKQLIFLQGFRIFLEKEEWKNIESFFDL